VAHYDKAIPPGGEGKITIRFNLKGSQGAVEKTSIVVTNDSENPHFTLVLKGQVED
jgi:hypothetical protein